MKKILSMVLVIVLVAGIAISGTMAYLTDRDNETNVFTVGDVAIELDGDFADGFELLPGKTYATNPLIKNVGKNAAWVWLTYAVPASLEKVVEVKTLGVNWEAAASHNFEADVKVTEDKIVKYAVTVLLYNTDTALAAEAKTTAAFETIGLDSSVDVTPEGDWYTVVSGETDPLGWNTEKDGAPFVFINAYAIQQDLFENVYDAINAYKLQWGSLNGKYEISAPADVWDGTADTSWYNDTDTEFELTTAEQLAGLADLVDGGNTFAGKTIKLGDNLDLYAEGADGEPVSFDPIGYGYDTVFKGTFDGQGNTISNLYQNGWALGLDYSTEGGGLFASVVDATIKNVNIDNAEIVMECIDMGALVGYSYGNCTYENITVSNSTVANYQRYTGGVVGEVNGTQTFKNVDVKDTVVSSLWGDFDCSLGGIVGGKWGDAALTFEDCDVSCELNTYNDITSTYMWHAYRRAGMLIGNSEETKTVDGKTVATASYLTAKNCTVTYGDWVNYTYCEFAGTSWPYVRVQAGYRNPAYSNPRYGHPKDANGNEVVDDNHVHNDGEDHNILITFDQLFGGGQGVYGTATHEGVTVVYPS